eukprot:TRINITY_DN1260_c0_g2_i10.p1 TRINITY_DN1260_c0_g2~~TRINITY_DN1260_c0_g2_i10.p1  ORF type:complete len:281 (+),score=27.36 TRINITY_DN1260_c0_g2_i10:174-1016(+)
MKKWKSEFKGLCEDASENSPAAPSKSKQQVLQSKITIDTRPSSANANHNANNGLMSQPMLNRSQSQISNVSATLIDRLPKLNDKTRDNIVSVFLKYLKERTTVAEITDAIVYVEEDLIELCLAIEKALFTKYKNTREDYKNHARNIYSNIKDPKNEDLWRRLVDRDLTAEELVELDVKDLASDKMKQLRKQDEKKIWEERQSDWMIHHAPRINSIYRCFKCKQNNVLCNPKQIRRGDEPMTLFMSCLSCGNTWKQSQIHIQRMGHSYEGMPLLHSSLRFR